MSHCGRFMNESYRPRCRVRRLISSLVLMAAVPQMARAQAASTESMRAPHERETRAYLTGVAFSAALPSFTYT